MAGLLDFLQGGLGGLFGGQMPPQQQMPPQYRPPQPSGPDIGGNAMAGFQNLLSNPTLGGLGQAITGFSTGQRTDPVGAYQQATMQNYRALLDAGIPEPQARLGAMDPNFQKTLLTPPSLQKTGTDPFTGQDTFAWAQPNQMRLTPATPGAAPGTQPTNGAPGVSMQGFSDALQKGVSGPALYDYLPKGTAATVKSMIEGRSPPPSSFALRSPQIQALIQAANAIDPNFDQTAWSVRNSTAKNYLGGGKQFQELQAIGTVAGHLDTLRKAADDLKNTEYPTWNSIGNLILKGKGDPRVDKFNTALQAVSNELSKAYRGGHVTEGDVKNWQSNINSSQSPEQLKSVIGTLNDLLASKRQRLEEGYAQSMGGVVPLPGEFRAQSDQAKKTFDNISAWSQGATAPTGASTAQPSPASAPVAIPEGATATNSKTGQKLIRQRGQWVPLI